MESSLYPDRLTAGGLSYVRPAGDEREAINHIIMDELVCGVFRPEAAVYQRGVIARMKDVGCDAVVLGCT